MTKPEFVLVHGACHGAWCWYKLVALMEQNGYKATPIDMLSSGIDKTSADMVTTIEDYSAPLIAHVANASSPVILVGHSMGGIVISYAMEKHPDKVAKAIYITAFMPRDGQSVVETVLPEFFPNLIDEGCLFHHFANGPNAPPTSIHFSSSLDVLSKFVYSECKNKEDIFLAKSLLNPAPIPITQQPLRLSEERYGSCSRFFIVTSKDALVPKETQEQIIKNNPPKSVFYMEQSDHSPFFSFPSELANLFYHISSQS